MLETWTGGLGDTWQELSDLQINVLGSDERDQLVT